MQVIRETTGGEFPPHIYILDSTTLVAYVKQGTNEPYWFKQPIKGFDKRGRTFQTIDKQAQRQYNIHID
jgi:hypothetical protein